MTRGEKVERRTLTRAGQFEGTHPGVFPDLLGDGARVGDFRLRQTALVGVIVILSRWTIDQYGGRGVSLLIGLTGLYDVDAAIVTAVNLPKGLLDTSSLAALLALPVLVNSVLKAVLVPVLGGFSAGLRAAIPLIASAILIAIGIALTNGFHFA